MSAALQLPYVCGEGVRQAVVQRAPRCRAPRRETEEQPAEELAFYRRHTQSLLRRYMHMSMQMGRVPSVLGECMFRGRVSSYRVKSFEDAVMADLCVLKSQMVSLLGEGNTGRMGALEQRVECQELRWQRAKGFAAAMGVLFTLLNLAVEVIWRR